MSERLDEDFDMDFIDYLGEIIKKEQECDYEKNYDKIDMVKKIYEMVKCIFGGNFKSDLKFNDPFKGMGVISIEGKSICCFAPEYFSLISRLASNINIYAKLNGEIHIDFCFYGCEVIVR